MSMQSIYLILSGSGLIYLAGLDAYGLYIAIAIFWVIAAFYKPLTKLAIWSIILFMTGFALIRIERFFFGSMPDTHYISILVIEILLAMVGMILVKR